MMVKLDGDEVVNEYGEVVGIEIKDEDIELEIKCNSSGLFRLTETS